MVEGGEKKKRWRKDRLMNEANQREGDETEMSHDLSGLTPLEVLSCCWYISV